MPKSYKVSLALSGPLASESLGKLKRLLHDLGPIKAPSMRLAGRISVALGAGYAAPGWEAVAQARVVLLHGAESGMARMVEQLAAVPAAWKGRVVVAMDCRLTSRALSPLVELGASAASLHSLPGGPSRWFLMEGRPSALRILRRYVESSHGRAIGASACQAELAMASCELMAPALLALADSAVSCLREAGVPLAQARPAVEALMQEQVRTFLRAGRKYWKGPQGRDGMDRRLDAARTLAPRVAGLAEVMLEASARYFEER